MTATATALATAPAVLALVQLAKDTGLPTKAAAPLAVVLGVLLAVADHTLAGTGLYNAASSGLILGLAAAGLYDAARLAAPKPTTTPGLTTP